MPNRKMLVIKRMSSIAICLGLGLLAQSGNPQNRSEHLPAILDLRCPAYSIACCQPITMFADVFGIAGTDKDLTKLKYTWEVSAGKITAGQGTARATFDTGEMVSDKSRTIRIRLSLDGGPPELEREKSCSITVNPKCRLPQLFDKYGDLSITDEKARLDRLGVYLEDHGSRAVVFVVGYAGLESCFWEAELRLTRAKKYLIEKHQIPAERIMIIDGGYRKNLSMELFTSSDLSCGPVPTPSLFGSKAHVNVSCGDKHKTDF